MSSIDSFIDYLVHNIPYYEQYGGSTSLEELPIVNKQVIRNNYDAFISMEIPKEDREKILQVLKGNFTKKNNSVNEVYEYKNFIFEETTGTSGVPFRVVKSEEDRFRIGAEVWRRRRKIDPSASPKSLYRLNHTSIHSNQLNTYNYDVGNILKIYNEIEERKIRWLHVSPNPLKMHVNILQEYGDYQFGNLKYIECVGNFFSEEQKKLYEDVFGATVINQYGSMETWPIAYTCINNSMHILDNIVLDLVDDNNEPITNYDEVGNILITCLDLRTMPFVRYRIGDYGKLVENKCSCGVKSPLIELIPGREVNIIKGFNEKKFGNTIFSKIVQGTARRIWVWDQIEFIQVQQMSELEFDVLINYFDNVNEFIDLMAQITEIELGKEVVLTPVFLDKEQLVKKREEKPNVFLCKY